MLLTEFDPSTLAGSEAEQTMLHSQSNVLTEHSRIALKLFKQAAQAGLPEAVTCLGHIYEIGGYECEKTGRFYSLTKRNLEKAIPLYEQAAGHGDELAMNFLGAYFFNVKDNAVEAVRYFRQASTSGNCARALNNLALCFEHGVATQQDIDTAISLYEKAARLAYAPALCNHAYLLFR